MLWSRKTLRAALLLAVYLSCSCGQGSQQSAVQDASPDAPKEPEYQAPLDLWPELISQCAKAYTLPPQAPWQDPQRFEGQLETKIQWIQRRSCDPNVTDIDLSAENSIALGEHLGQTSLLAQLTQHQERWGIKNLIWFDTQTGEPLDCTKAPNDDNVAPHGVILNPYANGQPVSVMYSFRANYGIVPLTFELSWWSPAWRSRKLDRHVESKLITSLERDVSFDLKKVALLPDGQLIFLYGNALLSIDAQNGAINWSVEPSDILKVLPEGAQYTATSIEDLEWNAADRTFAIHAMSIEDGKPTFTKLTVDSCGGLSVASQTPFVHELPFGEGKVFVSYERSSAWTVQTRDQAGSVIDELSLCRELFALDNERIACLKHNKYVSKLEMSIISWPSKVTTFKFDKSHTPGDSNPFYHLKGAALADGLFAMTVSYSNEEDNYESGVMFIDTHTGEIADFVRIIDPTANRPISASYTPLVDDEGTVYIADWSHIFAIKTNSKGLAKTGFPRGWTLGDNSNAGYFPSP